MMAIQIIIIIMDKEKEQNKIQERPGQEQLL